jgi:hypothetical protein
LILCTFSVIVSALRLRILGSCDGVRSLVKLDAGGARCSSRYQCAPARIWASPTWWAGVLPRGEGASHASRKLKERGQRSAQVRAGASGSDAAQSPRRSPPHRESNHLGESHILPGSRSSATLGHDALVYIYTKSCRRALGLPGLVRRTQERG